MADLPLPPNPVPAVSAEYMDLARAILAEAQRRVTRRSGDLARSGRVRVTRRGVLRKGPRAGGHTPRRVVVEFVAPYARAQERHSPYLNPGAKAVLSRWRGPAARVQAWLRGYSARHIQIRLGE